jgi:hypothetical protein
MKSKLSLIGRIALNVVLICSLGLVFSAVPTSAVTEVGLDIEGNVFVHDNGTKAPLCPEECLPPCDDFYVNATVTAIGGSVSGVQATIEIDGPAYLDPTETPTKQLGMIAGCTLMDVWWKLHCDGPGLVDITVIATGAGVPMVFDELEVEQCPPECPKITVRIIEPECGKDSGPPEKSAYPMVVQTSQVFAVKALLHVTRCNDDGTTVDGLVATIDIDGPAELVQGMPDHWDLGSLTGVGAELRHEVGWMLHCTGPGEVTITVDADFPGEGYGDVNSDFVTVIQRDPPCLDVEITSPDDGDDICIDCETFWVDIDVCNYCDALLKNVNATLTAISGGSSVNIISPRIVQLGDIGERGMCNNGPECEYCCKTHSWEVECIGEGEVIFEVEVTGENDDTGDQIADTDTVTIDQVDCIIDVMAPEYVSTEQCFVVEATAWNCTDAAIGTVDVTIDWWPPEAAHLAAVGECPTNDPPGG